MSEKKRRLAASGGGTRPDNGNIHLHDLPPHPEIDSTRMRELTGDDSIPPGKPVSLRVHKARVGEHEFLTGFCLGDGRLFSAVGLAVIDRLLREKPNATVTVVPISDRGIAWKLVLRRLMEFRGQILIFAFSDSETYDAGAAEVFYSPEIVMYDEYGKARPQLTAEQRRRVKEQAAAMRGSTPSPKLFEMPGVNPEEHPWVFELAVSSGRRLRVTAWNGRQDFLNDIPTDIPRLVGGSRVAIVQVDSPVGIDGRSSIALSNVLAEEVDGIVHWARDTATYQSIVREFVLADLPSAEPPELPADWEPELILMPVNDSRRAGMADLTAKRQDPTFHELASMLGSGIDLDDGDWKAVDVERAARYDMGSHLALPEEAALAGEQMLRSGMLRLPSKRTIFEYDTRDQSFERFVLLCLQMDPTEEGELGLIKCTPLMREGGLWLPRLLSLMMSFDGEIRFLPVEKGQLDQNPEFRDQLISMTQALFLGAVAGLESGRSVVHEVDESPDTGEMVHFRAAWT